MTGLTVHLHAWPTRFYLGLICSQVISMTAGSIVPHARKEVTNWEDHGPHSRDVQHTESEDSVMPLASSQKRGKGGCSSHSSPQGGGTEAADPELYYPYGSSPRAEQDVLREGRRSERKASSPKVCCKNVAFGNLTRSFKRGQI